MADDWANPEDARHHAFRVVSPAGLAEQAAWQHPGSSLDACCVRIRSDGEPPPGAVQPGGMSMGTRSTLGIAALGLSVVLVVGLCIGLALRDSRARSQAGLDPGRSDVRAGELAAIRRTLTEMGEGLNAMAVDLRKVSTDLGRLEEDVKAGFRDARDHLHTIKNDLREMADQLKAVRIDQQRSGGRPDRRRPAP